MRVRGDRECQDCGRRWSYYDTGAVTCPDCGSLRSRGVDDPSEHTAGQATLDLTPARDALDRGQPIDTVLREAGEQCRKFLGSVGFIAGGQLQPLDDTTLAAADIRHAADILGRSFTTDEAAELYLLSLLHGADAGDRPGPEAVPASLRSARGLAVVNVVEQYRRAIRTLTPETAVTRRQTIAAIDEQLRRICALDGDVNPAMAEQLVRAARDVGSEIVDGEEVALSRARKRLNRLP